LNRYFAKAALACFCRSGFLFNQLLTKFFQMRKIKNCFHFIIFNFFCFTISSAQPVYDWAKSIGADDGYSIKPDGANSLLTTIATVSCPNGTSELSLQNTISIFPNPSKGEFTIQMDNGNTSTINLQPLTIRIYDVFGRLVYEESIAKKIAEITPIAIGINFAKGIYQLKIDTEAGSI
jgi:hypothetical protein